MKFQYILLLIALAAANACQVQVKQCAAVGEPCTFSECCQYSRCTDNICMLDDFACFNDGERCTKNAECCRGSKCLNNACRPN